MSICLSVHVYLSNVAELGLTAPSGADARRQPGAARRATIAAFDNRSPHPRLHVRAWAVFPGLSVPRSGQPSEGRLRRR